MREYKISKKVGGKIRLARRKAGMTQEDLAEKVGVHLSTLGRIERGESNPPLQTINKIARGLSTKPKELF